MAFSAAVSACPSSQSTVIVRPEPDSASPKCLSALTLVLRAWQVLSARPWPTVAPSYLLNFNGNERCRCGLCAGIARLLNLGKSPNLVFHSPILITSAAIARHSVVTMPLDTATAENKPNSIRTEFKSNIFKWILSLQLVIQLPIPSHPRGEACDFGLMSNTL